MKPIRQGDVILIPCERPAGAATEHERLTLALGEATGHHHTAYPEQAGKVLEWRTENGRFIEVNATFWLRHQEHDQVRINPGQCYRIGEEIEYDPFEEEMKKVVD